MRPTAVGGPLVFALLLAPTCQQRLTGPKISGQWGGPHIDLVTTDSGAAIKYDCAHGRITEAVLPDVFGAFVARGVHVREHGGPIREGEIPDQHPARYAGRIEGNTMTLTVTLTDSATTLGTFTLVRGAAGQVFKCL